MSVGDWHHTVSPAGIQVLIWSTILRTGIEVLVMLHDTATYRPVAYYLRFSIIPRTDIQIISLALDNATYRHGGTHAGIIRHKCCV